MNKYILFLLFACSNISLNAKIVEHATIDSIMQYIDTPNTLVVFDIDNTLATSAYLIGSDAWFMYLVQQKQQQGYSLDQAINLSLPTYFHVTFAVPLVPVEKNTPEVVKEIQCKAPTVALTARSIYIADRTIQQLNDINISLVVPHIQQKELFLTLPTHIPSMYKQGILFSGNNDKGQVLVEFFKETNYYPSKVIFIDDKRKYLEGVEKVVEEQGISFVGIRYGACDEMVKNFDAAQAELEFSQFKAGLLPEKKSSSLISLVGSWTRSLLHYCLQ